MSGNENLNKKVFRRERKTVREGAEVMSSGMLFQTVAPAEEKDLGPMVKQRVRGIAR